MHLRKFFSKPEKVRARRDGFSTQMALNAKQDSSIYEALERAVNTVEDGKAQTFRLRLQLNVKRENAPAHKGKELQI